MTEPKFCDGDVITVAGLYDDGTQAPNEGPYDAKPLQQWRLKGPTKSDDITAYQLIPINRDGTVQSFRASTADYRVVQE